VKLQITALSFLLLAGCAREEATTTAAPEAARPAATTPAAPAAEAGNLKLEDRSGVATFTVKPKDDGFKGYDAQGQELGKAKVEADRVKLKDAADRELWKVKKKEDGAEVEDASGQRLYRLKSDGTDWKMEDGAGALVLKLKKKPNGYEARDAQGRTLAKVKVREGKVVFETEEGERLGQLDGGTDALASAWFALERFSPLERMALYAYFAKVGP
jgi:hypothetical protein